MESAVPSPAVDRDGSQTAAPRPAAPDPLAEPPATAVRLRLSFIDKLRGLVIVLMALDHVRDFFSHDALFFSATDLTKTSAALFMTRWITHICAPTFVLLAGVSIFLQRENGKRGWPLARFLLVRGLWLIFLELTFVDFAFSFHVPFLFFQVIWAIGFSFVLMAPISMLPAPVVLGIGILVVVGHDALHGVHPESLGIPPALWTLLIGGGRLGNLPAFVSYPALPWFGIMALGFGAGRLALLETGARQRWLLIIGAAFLACFAVLRSTNLYGDPSPWTTQADPIFSVLAFLNVAKYPPSLQYTLLMLGMAACLTPLVERLRGPVGQAAATLGRVPLFVYLLHLYLAHGLALAVGWIEGIPPRAFSITSPRAQALIDAHWGFGLPGVYLAWLVVVACLLPLAYRFAALKQRRRDWWLSYV